MISTLPMPLRDGDSLCRNQATQPLCLVDNTVPEGIDPRVYVIDCDALYDSPKQKSQCHARTPSIGLHV